MPTRRFRGNEIGPLTPALDARNVDNLFVLGGRNYSFDSKGVKTNFGDRYMGHMPFQFVTDIHGNRVSGRSFLHTPEAIYEWESTLDVWNPMFYFHDEYFESAIPKSFNGNRWAAAFLNNKIFFAHKVFGIYYVSTSPVAVQRIVTQINSTLVDGLPSAPIGMVETNARLVILTDTAVTWSAAADGLDWTPALGGPGFQVLAQRIGGVPINITSYAGGFIVWTTAGALLAEFIGGDAVWRFTAVPAVNLPQNTFCLAKLNDDSTLIGTVQGLYTARQGAALEPFRPEFNEFLRLYLTENPQAQMRIEYDQHKDRLFVSLRNHHEIYDRTYVLVPTLQAWGEFNERTYGIVPLSPTEFGWVGQDRIARRWIEQPFREAPAISTLNYRFPRLVKGFIPYLPDSVIESHDFGVCQHDSHVNAVREGFYQTDVDTPAAPSQQGLNAEVQIGYIRPSWIEEFSDGLIQIQQIVLGSYEQSLPPDLIPGNLEYDTFELHYERMYDPIDDLDEGDEEIDLDELDGIDDLNGFASLFNEFTYDLSLESSLDGLTAYTVTPLRARFDSGATTYSCETNGVLHKMILKADNPGQMFQVRYLEFTLGYGGRIG